MQGRLLEVNDTYCRMSGYSEQELLSMTIADLELIESADEIIAHIEKIKTSGEHFFTTQHRRKDGSIFDSAPAYPNNYQPAQQCRQILGTRRGLAVDCVTETGK
jgi:PAS domain-containing protein